jgi:hypothetical protein
MTQVIPDGATHKFIMHDDRVFYYRCVDNEWQYWATKSKEWRASIFCNLTDRVFALIEV